MEGKIKNQPPEIKGGMRSLTPTEIVYSMAPVKIKGGVFESVVYSLDGLGFVKKTTSWHKINHGKLEQVAKGGGIMRIEELGRGEVIVDDCDPENITFKLVLLQVSPTN